MKKSELRQIIREEIGKLNEGIFSKKKKEISDNDKKWKVGDTISYRVIVGGSKYKHPHKIIKKLKNGKWELDNGKIFSEGDPRCFKIEVN